MRMLRFATCAVLAAANLQNREEDALATRAATQAVTEAEATETHGNAEDKEAFAVATAAGDAIKLADAEVPTHLINKAEINAEEAYRDLVHRGVPEVAAAEDAAQVAVGEVDASMPSNVAMDTVQAAEAASVVAEKAVSDHPDSQREAVLEARTGINSVVTAESTAAKAASDAIDTVEREKPTARLEEKESWAAATAAADAMSAGHPLAEQALQEAKDKADSVFEGLVDNKMPVDMAAKEAAREVIGAIDADASPVVKDASEAAAVAAAVAVSKFDDKNAVQQGAAKEEAAKEAATMVTTEKLASKAAVEGDIESQFQGSRLDKEAAGAAAAALDAIKSGYNIDEKLAEQAERAATEAYKAAVKSASTERAAAEKAANVAIEAVNAASKEPLKQQFAEAAIAAAVASAKAADESEARSPGLALDVSTAVAAENLDLAKAAEELAEQPPHEGVLAKAEELAEVAEELPEEAVESGGKPLLVLLALGLAAVAYHGYDRHRLAVCKSTPVEFDSVHELGYVRQCP